MATVIKVFKPLSTHICTGGEKGFDIEGQREKKEGTQLKDLLLSSICVLPLSLDHFPLPV